MVICMKKLIGLIDKLNLKNKFFFLGYTKNIHDFLNSLDIFVLPSITEGFSLSTVEAISCGLPVVVTRCGGPEEIVTENLNGIIVKTHSENELAKAILKLINIESEKLRSMKEEARVAAKKFSINEMISAYTILYESIVK